MSDDDLKSEPPDPTRRKFLLTTGSGVAATMVASYAPSLANSAAGESDSPMNAPNIEGAVPITLKINGKEHSLRIDPRTTLLDCSHSRRSESKRGLINPQEETWKIRFSSPVQRAALVR